MKLLKSFRVLSGCCRGEDEPLKDSLFASFGGDVDDELYNSLHEYHQSILEGRIIGKSKRNKVVGDLDEAMHLVLSDTCSTFDEDSQEMDCQIYQELLDDEELFDSETDSNLVQIEMVPISRNDETYTQPPAMNCISKSNSHRSPLIPQPYIPRQQENTARNGSYSPRYGQSAIESQSLPVLINNFEKSRDEKSDEMKSESFSDGSILQCHPSSRLTERPNIKITRELLHVAKNSFLDGMNFIDEWNKDRIMVAFANWLERRGMVTLRCIKDNCPSRDETEVLSSTPLLRRGALGSYSVEIAPTHVFTASNTTYTEISNISNPNICWSDHALKVPDIRAEKILAPCNGFESFSIETSSPVESFNHQVNAPLDDSPLHGDIASTPSENGGGNSESPPQEYYITSDGVDTEVEVQLFPPKKNQLRNYYISSNAAGSAVEVQLSPPKKSKKWSGSKLKSRFIAAVKKRSHPFVRKTKLLRRTSITTTDSTPGTYSLELSATTTGTSTSSSVLSVDLDSLDEQTLVSNYTYDDDESEIISSITTHTCIGRNRNTPVDSECKSLKKAIDNLVACNILTSSPSDIARFLRDHQSRIGAIALGNFLGEAGKSSQDMEYYNLIRYYYVSAVSFKGMDIEQG